MQRDLDQEQRDFMQSQQKPAAKVIRRAPEPAAPKQPRVSLFAKRMGISHREELKGDEPVVLEVSEKTQHNWKEDLDIQTTGFPTVFELTKEELKSEERKAPRAEANVPNDIHLENMQKLRQMTPEEVKAACEELESNIPAELLANLRERGRRKLKANPEAAVKQAENKPTCLHNDEAPQTRVEMLRFNFEGRLVQEFADDQWAQSEEQGMSVKELGLLCRSSMANQRTLALETLKLLLLMGTPLTHAEVADYLVDNSKIAITLCTLLSDSNLNCRLASLRLTHTLICLYLDINYSVQHFDWLLFPTCLQSESNALLDKDERNAVPFDEEASVRHPKPPQAEDLSDWELSQFDLTGMLLRAGLLGRILPLCIERPEFKDTVIEICLACALHSVSGCYTVLRCKGLLEELVSEATFPAPLLKLLTVLGKASHSTAFAVSKLISPHQSKLTELVSRQDCQQAVLVLRLHSALLDYKMKLLDFEFLRAFTLDLIRSDVADEIFVATLLNCVVRESDLFDLQMQCVGIVEVCLFKGLQAASRPDFIESMLEVTRIYLSVAKTLPIEGTSPAEQLENCMTQLLLPVSKKLSVGFQLVLKLVDSPKSVKRLDQAFSIELENSGVPLLKAASRLIEVICDVISHEQGLSRTYQEELVAFADTVKTSTQHILQQAAQLHKSEKRVPPLTCYRLKPALQLHCCALMLQQRLHLRDTSSCLLALHFTQSYDEHLAEYLLGSVFRETVYEQLFTDYFSGLLSSEQHLAASAMVYLQKPGLPCHFLGNKETKFLPIPFDFFYSFSQYPKHLIPLLMDFLTTAEQSQQLSVVPTSSKVDALNSLFNDDLKVPREFEDLARAITSMPEFFKELGKSKDSILAFADFYVSSSFCDPVASKWLVCFLTGDVDVELRRYFLLRSLHEKLDGLLPRIASAAGPSFYGASEAYNKRELDWKLVQLYEQVEPTLERNTSLQVMMANMLGTR